MELEKILLDVIFPVFAISAGAYMLYVTFKEQYKENKQHANEIIVGYNKDKAFIQKTFPFYSENQ